MKNYLDYDGKTCIVTGAASGMGKACTEALVSLGAEVYAMDIAPVQIEGIKSSVHVNMGDKTSIDHAFRELPDRIDRFFGFAGVSGEKTSAKVTLCINFVSNQYILREYIPKRIPAGGAVLMCTSVGANNWHMVEARTEIKPLAEAKTWEEAEAVLDSFCENLSGGTAYRFSKRALQYITTKAAMELIDRGIRVNSIKPGATKSGLSDEFKERYLRQHPGATVEDYEREFTKSAEAREMAEPAIFLNSHMASYIAGIELPIDYGQEAAVFLGLRSDLFPGVPMLDPKNSL